MEYEETEEKIFKLNQDGKEYLVSISIFGDCVRVSCQENLGKDGNFYETDFSLEDLSSINRYFILMSSINEAQNELIKAIEKQQVGIDHNPNLIKIIFYITIGTDNINFKLPLTKRDAIFKRIKTPEEQVPFTGMIQLKNKGNYPQDEERIVELEKKNAQLIGSQRDLISDVKNLMDVTQKLINESNLLYEENAKLNARLQKIQKENFERNLEVEVLKDEEQTLNDENIKLKNYNADLERLLQQKRENLAREYMESKQRPTYINEIDYGNGPKAISSRYDDAQIKTFIPRVTVKPMVEAYDEGLASKNKPPFYYTDQRLPKNLLNNSSNIDKLNNTDINYNNNNNPRKNSFRTNELITNNASYNKIYDNNLNGNDNNESDKDPQDNYTKRNKKPKKLPVQERISEKTNDYEEEENNRNIRNGNVFNNNEQIRNNESYFNETESQVSQVKESDVRDNDSYPSNYHLKQKSEEKTSEYEDEEEQLNYLNSDIILSSTEEEMLLNKINKHGKQTQMKLIYKATVDSDRAEIFHQKCDSAQRTLVLIETINERRFGGYTTQSWEGNGIDKDDSEAFVFSLDKLQIYNIISGQPAIGCYPKYGPVFLGCQIKVNDNFFVKGGTTYRKNTNYAINSDFELNDGVKFFGIKEIEVFEVQLI